MPTPEAQKALDLLLAELGPESETDKRSVVSRIMAAVMIKHSGVLPARKAVQAIHAHFVDWNEVRISDDREVVAVLTSIGIEQPKSMHDQVSSVLHDIYQQYNITNFEWNQIDEVLHSKPIVVEGQEPQPEAATIRDEGLPKHPVHTGFLDGKRLLNETTQLELKLVQAKNSDHVCNFIYDNPIHSTANVVWAVAMRFGVLRDGMDASEAMAELRDIMGKDAPLFAKAAIIFYERNSRSLDKYFKQQRALPVDEAAEVPFSVQIGFMNPEDVRRNEPLMPRSDGIGRLSKRAIPKFLAPAPGTKVNRPVAQVALASNVTQPVTVAEPAAATAVAEPIQAASAPSPAPRKKAAKHISDSEEE